MRRNIIVFLSFSILASTLSADVYKSKVLPFLESYCTRCHDEDKTKAGFRVDTLDRDILGGKDLSRWEHVVDRLYLGDMPPEDTKKQPSNKLRIEVTEWIANQLTKAHEKVNSTGGQVVYRRLNRNEYDNTIRDLFGLYGFSFAKENFPEDEASHGFDNIGKTLTMSPLLMDRVLAGADEALKIGLSGFINKRKKYEEKVVDPLEKMWKGEEMKKTNYRMVDGKLTLVSDSGVRIHVRQAGFYTLRLSLRAMGKSEEAPLIEVLAGKLGNGNPPRLRPGHFSFPSGKTTTVEVTAELRDREEFQFKYINHGNVRSAAGGGKKPTIPNPKFKLADSRALVIEKIELLGPFREWPARKSPLIIDGYSKSDLERLLTDFASKAFRRSVNKSEISDILTMAKATEKSGGYKEGVRVGLKAILCSPHFLYINEKPGRLDDYGIASRLSYFLWSSMPDAELFKVAAQGKLSDPKFREAQIKRMLQDPKAKSFSQNFVGQWLELRTLGETTPDDVLYPEYDIRLEESMSKETLAFFNEILHDPKLTIHDFIDADFGMINDRLAKHYGLNPVSGFSLRRVKLKPSNSRRGLLGQASVLTLTANGTVTSPIVRGSWILENILGTPPPLPPPDVPGIEPDLSGATTIKQQLDKHRSVEVCASCHKKIDPLGFALENYDVIGQLRKEYRVKKVASKPKFGRGPFWKVGPSVEPTGRLSSGHSLNGPESLTEYLVEKRELFARCLTKKLMTYGIGRHLEFMDRPSVEKITRKMKSVDFRYPLQDLIIDIVNSEPFLTK